MTHTASDSHRGARIVADPAMAEGLLNGFDADGELVVSTIYMPVFRRLIGNEAAEQRVTSWHVAPSGVRRIALIGAWNRAEDYPTVGNA